MNVEIEKLTKALTIAIEENEFPDNLTAEVNNIINTTDQLNIDIKDIRELREMIEDYDPYGDVGCFNTAVSPEEIKSAIEKIVQT